MPAHNPSFILLFDLTKATLEGKPYLTPWTVFVRVKLISNGGDFTAIVLKDYFTGEEVIAPLRNSSAYPKIVTVEEDFSIFQRFETYDTDPLRPVEKGFVAVKVDGVPDAKIPVHLVSPAHRHAHDPNGVVAV